MFVFGAGRARLTTAGAGGQTLELGVVQSATLDLKVDLKELRGAFRYPVAVGDGKGTASGTVNFMQFWPAVLAGITGSTEATGAPQFAIAEGPTTIPGTPFQVTLTNGSTMVAGSEIVFVNIGGTAGPVFYKRVTAGAEASATAANPTAGKYSISAGGVITFKAADGTATVTYMYTPAVSTGNSNLALTQIGMNTATTFALTMFGIGKNIYTNQAQQFICNLNACLAPSLKLNFKLDDFTDLALDYQAFIDANGSLGNFYLVNPAG